MRAVYDDHTIRVYQAYSAQIAGAASSAGRFVSPPFSLTRMTWVKPSFLWMMYRSGWAAKDPGQARVLAVDLTRDGFLLALGRGCLSHYEAGLPYDYDEHRDRLREADVVVQWDPERDLVGRPLPYRSLQVGLRGDAVRSYVSDWIVRLHDVTANVHRIKRHLDAGGEAAARELLPAERTFPLPPDIIARLNASPM